MTRDRRKSPADRKAERAAITDVGPVMDAAAAFLAVRPRSTAETRRRLLYLGYPETLVDAAIEQLSRLGYLDDEAFARAWVESRDRARPRGELALRRELALKGVARELVDEVLAERESADGNPDGDVDLAAALRLLERRRSALEREPDVVKRRHKAYALLARNGFDPDACRAAATEMTRAVRE